MAKNTYSNAQQTDIFHPDNPSLKASFALNMNNRKRISPAKKVITQDSFLEFFAGSGLVAESFKGIFKPIWANDICPQKKSGICC